MVATAAVVVTLFGALIGLCHVALIVVTISKVKEFNISR